MKIKIKKLKEDSIIPSRAHADDAGADLFYCGERYVLWNGERHLFETGVSIEIPYSYVGLVHPRSGLSNKCGITTINSPGTIDSGYRGELFVNLINLDNQPHVIDYGMRIAQLVIQKVELAEFELVEELNSGVRGSNGWGSTGI